MPVQIEDGAVITLSRGNAFTVTEPFVEDEQPVWPLPIVNVKEIELPEAGELKLTAIGDAPREPLLTVVIPVPEIPYLSGLPVVEV